MTEGKWYKWLIKDIIIHKYLLERSLYCIYVGVLRPVHIRHYRSAKFLKINKTVEFSQKYILLYNLLHIIYIQKLIRFKNDKRCLTYSLQNSSGVTIFAIIFVFVATQFFPVVMHINASLINSRSVDISVYSSRIFNWYCGLWYYIIYYIIYGTNKNILAYNLNSNNGSLQFMMQWEVMADPRP